jgi:Uma2 family endonuclease
MTVQETLLTVEEFWKQYAGKPFELVEGEIVAVTPAGGLHGAITRRVASHLGNYVDENELGEVYGAETGFYLSPTVMRGADAAFVRKEKLEKITDLESYIPFAPDLAVEVVSPNDMATEIQKKVKLYLAAGTALVWVIYPDLRSVVAHYPDQTSKTFSSDSTLDGSDVLPGLEIAVSHLFPPEKSE